jgi:beta-phosphoglucomutase
VIEAVIFDLDGTLVETEQLKALSYARAAVELRPDLREADVLAAFPDFVGGSRDEVAKGLTDRFGLAEAAAARMAELGVSEPWQAYVRIRLDRYEAMLSDAELVRAQQWPHNIALLHEVRRTGCKVALATMSHRPQVRRVLDVLGLADAFDLIATREDVSRGKPDPEIYVYVARELGIPAEDCLVVEDSPTGVKAALAAGMYVVAVATPLTKAKLHQSALLPPEHIVDDPDTLPAKVAHVIAHHAREVPHPQPLSHEGRGE